MTNDKYYTPTIEEFHIGFEYEFMNGNVWEESEMNIQDYKTTGSDYEKQDSWFEEELLGGIRTIRVKYLDQEDIESLGWRHKESDLDETFYYGDLRDYDLFICGDGKLLINDNTEDEIIYRGMIKNKSELKRLMKQLGIYEQ